jgi:two-component system, NtrC family, nitrogen regulation sensor histidine kinase NtrY
MKHYRLQVFLRIVLLTVLLGLLVYFFFVEERWLRSIYLLFFVILAIGELFWYLDRTNRDIATFLTSLMQNDFTTSFSGKLRGKSFSHMYDSFNVITQKFKEISAEKEARHHYLEALVSHVQVGIISFDHQEKVHLINHAFRQLTGKQSLGYLNGLESVDPKLLQTIRLLRPGQSRLLSITIDNQTLQLNLHATAFRLQGIAYTLVSLQNIREALDIREVEAWQKLMRVLTHEIMNSVSPITSLSDTLIGMIAGHPGETAIEENIRKGLEAIHARSSGLESFTRAYRQLTGIPAPRIQEILMEELIGRIYVLLKNQLSSISWEVAIPHNLKVKADPDLLGQVFINLIKNALDALENSTNPGILVRVIELSTGIEIRFMDNGQGIPSDKLAQVFVPFFTTKKTGTGIGLAVCQQIIQLHGGSIDVQSVPGETVFRIFLPN